jgi:tetratricopeptide (TPR) repeat protein
MKKLRWALVFGVSMLLVSGSLMAQDFLKEADALYDQGGIENVKQAVDLYLKAVEANPDDYEANWKCARAHREYGNKAKRKGLEGWQDICKAYGKKGMQYAQKAIEIAPEKTDGHYYYGLSVGIYSDGVSILTALKEGLKNKTQSSFEKAYELDKMYNEAGPMLSLGRFWSVLPWPMRDRKKALEYYREFQSTPYFADNAEAKIFVAELLMKLKGEENKTEAQKLLTEAAQSDDPYFKDWANRLLQEFK